MHGRLATSVMTTRTYAENQGQREWYQHHVHFNFATTISALSCVEPFAKGDKATHALSGTRATQVIILRDESMQTHKEPQAMLDQHSVKEACHCLRPAHDQEGMEK